MDLTRIAATGLYAPPAGPRFVFLLWNTTGAPATIPFSATWADEGPPRAVGWYVFVDAMPQAGAAATLESDLRGALTADRGLAWAVPATGSAPFELTGAVPIELDADGRAVVSAASPIVMPTGMPPLGVAAGLRVTALPTEAGGEPAALGLTDPAGRPALGLVVALTGTTSGGVSFRAFLASPVTAAGTVKPLAAVQIDPLDPFSPDRTRVTPLGRDYALVHEAGGVYGLEEAPA